MNRSCMIWVKWIKERKQKENILMRIIKINLKKEAEKEIKSDDIDKDNDYNTLGSLDAGFEKMINES